MKPVLPLFIMIDACGWEILRDRPFANGLAPNRSPLESVFGYSSACIPSILSGRWPDSHRNWCYFVHDPDQSPFGALKSLRWLPRALTSRRIVRRIMTKLVKKRLRFCGYFDLYNIPFAHIHRFDFSEKKSPLLPEGLNRGPNIFDRLEENGVPYFVSDPDRSEAENRDDLIRAIEAESISFSFLYWPGLDGLMHMEGNDSPLINDKLAEYEAWTTQILEAARKHYEDIPIYLFSDHGMANCDVHLDLMGQIEALGLRFGDDYVAVYDSTMARFWFFNDQARETIVRHLAAVPEGRILSKEELQSLQTWFEDHHFGELIFLVEEGTLIVPSHMGERPIRAMHGYHPTDRHSYASLLTNQAPLPEPVEAIPHIHRLMVHEADRAHAANEGTAAPPAPALAAV